MERTQHIRHGEARAPALPQPSYVAQALTVTARILDMHPADRLGPTVLDDALRTGIRAITATLPSPVRTDVHRIVHASLPPASLKDTQGQYAAQLRETANAL
ncbi:hypothetical protein ABZ864_40480 [Streptomyces sp. NPDC047082]|uniref:hypothetical protein n=1 Tax=Streptomyces sp. NPDC047082 TaxID=3155259 RepID=UPI0033F72A11